MMNSENPLLEQLRAWRDENTTMYEEWHNDTIWELVDADSNGQEILAAEFERLPDNELQKLHLAMLLLSRYPCLPAYVFLTDRRGFSPEMFKNSLYEGAAELRRLGKIR